MNRSALVSFFLCLTGVPGCTAPAGSEMPQPEGTGSTGSTGDESAPTAPEARSSDTGTDTVSASDAGGSTAESTSEGAGETDGEPSPACGFGFTCTPSAPDGWEGPYALYEDGEECGLGYLTEIWTGGGSIAGAAPSCDCACEIDSESCPQGGSITYFENGCGSGFTSFTVLEPADVNVALQTPGAFQFNQWPVTDVADATCAVTSNTSTFPPTSVTDVARLCETTAATEACEGELEGECLLTTHAPTCISQAGDVECPTGPYQTRQVYYADTEDQRTCACGCEADAACGPGQVESTFVSDQGVTVAVAYVADNECTSIYLSGELIGASYTPGTGESTCTAEGQILGQVQLVQPTTVCCS